MRRWDDWLRFTHTGSVEDYLIYRECGKCREEKSTVAYLAGDGEKGKNAGIHLGDRDGTETGSGGRI